MANIKNVSKSVLFASLFLLLSGGAKATLPTIDAANIAGTISIVKNGGMNLETVAATNGNLGRLMTIIGDCASSLSKFQQEYGEDIAKIDSEIKKARERKKQKEAEEQARIEAELETEKQAYQNALDQAEQTEEKLVEQSGLKRESNEQIRITSANKQYDDTQQEPDLQNQSIPSLSIENKQLKNTFDTNVKSTPQKRISISPVKQVQNPDTPKLSGTITTDTKIVDVKTQTVTPRRREGFIRPQNASRPRGPQIRDNNGQSPNTLNKDYKKLKVINDDVKTQSSSDSIQPHVSPTDFNNGENTQEQYRVSPRTQNNVKRSYSFYHNNESMLFASMTEKTSDTTYGGGIDKIPSSCALDAETFINDEAAREKCIRGIIQRKNTDDNPNGIRNTKDCNRMVFEMVIELLGEATKAKYEAANYSDTLDKQDEVAGKSTNVRGDLTVLAMSNKQTQLLLNRISMIVASELLLKTAKEVCAAKEDVLPKADEDAQNSGEE